MCSSFSHSNGSNYSHGMPEFSYFHREPSQGSTSGHLWTNGTSEGAQYFHHDPPTSNGHAQNGISDTFSSFPINQDTQGSEKTGRRSISGPAQSQWDRELSASAIGSQELSRMPSQDSIGAHSQGTSHSSVANSYDHPRSARMYPQLSQVSFPISSASSDVTRRSHSPDGIYTPTQQMGLQPFENYSFQGTDEITGDPSVFHRNSTSGLSSNPLDSSSYSDVFTTSADDTYTASYLASQRAVARDTLLYPNAVQESPTLWDPSTSFLDSRSSSPFHPEDRWVIPSEHIMTSTNSPLECSPSVESLSPRYIQDFPEIPDLPHPAGNRVVKKAIAPRQSKVNSDIARNPRTTGTSEASEDSLKYTGRVEDNNARVHVLYHNVTPKSDGLYHCPWEGQDGCQHKPEKLKCNYDKFVDSHLKPYRCKVLQCENVQFSSTACLLRHEREAHAMHGHGEKPFLCTYEGCDRGVLGNGFPRHWNLRDHMRRVHNDPGPPKSNASGGSPQPSGPARGKKRKAGERPDSPVLEKNNDKAVKRIPTPPQESKQEPKEPSPMKRYQQNQQKLSIIVQNLHDPSAPNYVALFHEASICFQVMQTAVLDINAKNLPQTG